MEIDLTARAILDIGNKWLWVEFKMSAYRTTTTHVEKLASIPLTVKKSHMNNHLGQQTKLDHMAPG